MGHTLLHVLLRVTPLWHAIQNHTPTRDSNVVVWFGVEKKATGLLHGGVAGSVSLL